LLFLNPMTLLKTDHPLALRLLMTDDIYSAGKEQVKTVGPEPEKPEPAPEASEKEAVSFHYSGENNKYLLIVVNDPIHTVINPADLTALTSILAAKNLELRDVAVMNLSKHYNSTFKEMKEFFSCSKLVLLGINPKDIGLPEIKNNSITTLAGTKILASFSISEMMKDVPKKKAFWNEMKQL
jgi:hypothetical protein